MKTAAIASLVLVAMIISCAWMYMILVGIMHHDWWSRIPPMGFHTALVLSAILFTWVLLCAIASQALGRIGD